MRRLYLAAWFRGWLQKFESFVITFALEEMGELGINRFR